MKIETQIHDRRFKLLRFIESRVVGPKVEAEDIYGEALLKMWEIIEAGKFRPGYSIDAFMIVCARAAIGDYYRKKNRAKRICTDEYKCSVRIYAESPEKEYELAERSMAFLEMASEILSDIRMKILILSLFQSMKHYEIAYTLGIPRATVSSHLRRDRKRLGDVHLNKARF